MNRTLLNKCNCLLALIPQSFCPNNLNTSINLKNDDVISAHLFLLISVMYGSWYDHVKSWWKKSKNSRILFVFYEDMIEVRNGRHMNILVVFNILLASDNTLDTILSLET